MAPALAEEFTVVSYDRLAEGTGATRAELPGGHVGFVTHPEPFVDLVRRCARGRPTRP